MADEETQAEWPEGVTSALKPSDVLWVMDWSARREDGTRLHPDQPEQEEEFESDKALAMLLMNDVIFLNSHWWEEDWPERARKQTALCVNCNDVFAWGCADGEGIEYAELEELYRLWLKYPRHGGDLWCVLKRGQMPQSPVAQSMRKAGIDLDGRLAKRKLRANHYDGVSGVLAARKYERYCAWERERGNEPREKAVGWWDGWREFAEAVPDWNTPEWQTADEAAVTAWRLENGYEEAQREEETA